MCIYGLGFNYLKLCACSVLLAARLVLDFGCFADPLTGASFTFALREAGVDVDHVEYEGMIHGFFSMDEAIDVAADAQDQVAAALKAAFAS